MEKRIVSLLMVIMLLVTSLPTSVMANNNPMGDQVFSNKGIDIGIGPDGKAHGTGVTHNSDGSITIKASNQTRLPPGTTDVDISFKTDDIKNIGSNGNLDKNGHAFANGIDALEGIGNNRLPNPMLVPGSKNIFVDAKGNTYVSYDTEITIPVEMVRQTPSVSKGVQNAAKRLVGKGMTF